MLLLVHGGLWEEGMGADRFWRRPGISAGLEEHGFEVCRAECRDGLAS